MAKETIRLGINYETVLSVPAHCLAPLTDILLECEIAPNKWSEDVDVRINLRDGSLDEANPNETGMETQEGPIPYAEGSSPIDFDEAVGDAD